MSAGVSDGRLFAAAEIRLGRQRSPQHESGQYPVRYLRAANVKDGELDLTNVKVMNFEPNEQVAFALRAGDVLVTEGSGSLAAVGASAVWGEELSGKVCFQNTLIRLRPRPARVDGRFLGWWARAAHARGQFASIAAGAGIFHLSSERVKALPIFLPSLDEQSRIADFLDCRIAEIDAAVVARKAQISCLAELELARIGAALGGVDVSGDREWTGLPWLPSIPRSWSMGPVYAYFDVELGKMLNAERATGENLKPYLRNANIRWHDIDTQDLSRMVFAPDEKRRYSLRVGDMLVCEGGSVGEAAIWDGRISECYYQKSLHRVRRRTGVPVEWLMYWLRYAKAAGVFDAGGNVSTIPHLTGEQLATYRIPIPLDGDLRVRQLSAKLATLKRAKDLLLAANSLLAERRRSLITAAVAGQLDVTTARGDTA